MATYLVLSFLFSLSFLSTATAAPGKYARVVQSSIVSNTTYDFVIIGGGIAGLTVADRLTEDSTGMTWFGFSQLLLMKYSQCLGD